MNTNKKMKMDPEIQGQLCRIANILKREAAMELNLYMTCNGEVAMWDGVAATYYKEARVQALLKTLLKEEWFDESDHSVLLNLEKTFTKCAEMVRERRLELWPLDRTGGQK